MSTTTTTTPTVTSTVTTTSAQIPAKTTDQPPSSIINLVDLSFNNSGLNPDISLNYDNTYVYFNKFRPNYSGMVYSYVSTTTSVYLKPNSKSKDIELYYSNSITLSKKIHNIANTRSDDLELFIEHKPSPSNFNKKMLYVCICLTEGNSSDNSGNGFNTFFDNIQHKYMILDTQSKNATLDNLKMNQQQIAFTGGILNYIHPEQSMFPAGVFYYDVSGNSVMVLNKPIPISSGNYDRMRRYFSGKYLTQPPKITDVLDTNITPKDPKSMYTITCGIKVNESFTSLREGFANLKEGLASLKEGLAEGKYQYCKPADNSNGNHVTTVALNTLTQNKNDSLLIDWIIASVMVVLTIIFMYFVVPDAYVMINSKLGYDVMFSTALTYLSFLVFVGGGIAAIACSRYVNDCPKVFTQLGLFVIIAYALFKLVIYAQKNTIRDMLNKQKQFGMEIQINNFITNVLDKIGPKLS
jgi:hypothetical protein